MRRSPLRRTLTFGAAVAAFATSLLGAPAAALGGGCGEPLTEGTGTRVEMTQRCYSPAVLHVSAGDTVTFANLDGTPHPTSGRTGSGSGEVLWLEGQPGSEETAVFDDDGTFPFACMAHPGMVGLVVVGDGVADALPAAGAGADAPGAAAADGTAAADPAEAETGGAGGVAPAHQLGAAAAVGAALALLGSFLVRRRTRPAEAGPARRAGPGAAPERTAEPDRSGAGRA